MDKPPSPTVVKNEPLLLLVLALLSGIAPLSIDLYLPAMPAMAEGLGATSGQVQLTLSTFMLGYAVGMLAWGPLGDRFGRRAPMLAGLVVYVVASVMCALAANVESIIALRMLQALGGCAIGALANAVVADVFERERSARAMSLINTVFLSAPLVAPTLGGLILAAGGWRTEFWVLAGCGVISLGGVLLLPETLRPERRRPMSAASVMSGYRSLLKSARYRTIVSVTAFYTGGMFAYIVATPFIYIELFHVPAKLYGLLFGLNVVGMMGVSFINSRVVMRYGPDRLFRIGVLSAAAAAVAVLISAWTGFGGLIGLAAPLFVFLSALALVSNNGGAMAIFEQRHAAGAASALMGASFMIAGAVFSGLAGALADGTPRPMAVLIAVGAAVGLAIYWRGLGRNRA